MMTVTFTAVLLKSEGKNATGISVPAEVVSALGSHKRPPVRVTLNGYTYRTTVAAYGDVFMLPVSAEHREAAGIQAEDVLEVTIELDLEPRTVSIPDDLAAALTEHPEAAAAFDTLSYSRRKEFVRQVEDAKTPETRQRRIAGIISRLAGDA